MKIMTRSLVILSALTFLNLAQRTCAQDTDNGDFNYNDPANQGLALNYPDEFNWKLLAAISKEAPPSLQFPAGAATTHNAVWETWADDPFTFPAHPVPGNPPKWQDRNKNLSFEPILQLQLRFLEGGKQRVSDVHTEALIPDHGTNNVEVVFRNKSSFDFIINNDLFYQEGLAAAYKQGVNSNGYPSGVKLEFNPDAVEVKAVYSPLEGNPALNKDNCHWNYAADGKAYGLVALHIMSKQLPNWTWATWEWSGNTPDQPNGNPGRSDWYGSRDDFGAVYTGPSGGDTHFQAPNVDKQGNPVLGALYPSGKLTGGLLKIFKDAGYSDEWLKEWSNYRLKGSQVDFTDPTGAANLVGNSVTENGFVQTSSCMTCHGSASVGLTGRPNPSIGFTLDGQSRYGPIDPAWFYDVSKFDANQQYGRYAVTYYPVDFVWAFLRAKPAGK